MKSNAWRSRMLASSRGQILQLLRGEERTVNELAAALDLTDNAVRAHLVSLERDGLVAQSGSQPGFRKPHTTFALTPDAEQIFPKSYGPLLDLVLAAVSKKLAPQALRAAMREVGKKAAQDHRAELQGKTRTQRINAALRILKELGGTATFEKKEGKHWIRGHGCPLAAATANHSEACVIAESLLSEVIGAPVKEHCQRGPNPSCCFEVR